MCDKNSYSNSNAQKSVTKVERVEGNTEGRDLETSHLRAARHQISAAFVEDGLVREGPPVINLRTNVGETSDTLPRPQFLPPINLEAQSPVQVSLA